jgi:membrane-associated protease RseP (regulator of RpoE activity)
LLNQVTVRPHSLSWGYGIPSVEWLPVLAPLLVAAFAHLYERPARTGVLAMLALACFVLAGCASSKTPQQRSWIGGEYKPVKHLEDGSRGLLVTGLRTNTPAARSGLREGDLILRAAGKPIEKLPAFQDIIDAAQPGTSVPMSVLRDGTVLDLPVRTGRETFTPSRAIVVGLLLSHEWDPWPNPDFSLVALGYKRQHKRLDLDSPESRFKLAQTSDQDHPSLRSSEGWEVWLPVFSFSTRKRIVSQSDIEE